MATQTISQTVTPNLPVNLTSVGTEDSPDWLVEFQTKGWTVVRGAVPKEKALEYAEKGYQWLESWNTGFDRHDPSKRDLVYLPFNTRGGLYNLYGIAHEQFVWDLKSEPGLVDKFEKLWGTKELLVSYDGVNLSLPNDNRPKTDAIFKPWSHVDQSPLKTGFECAQGILNLFPNGPEDGGLMVLDGSNRFYTELWEHFDHKKGEKGWNERAWQLVDEEMCAWLISKGCKWVKVCAQPGDLMLWDSRTIHYGAPPSSSNARFAAYVCYKPKSMVPEELQETLKNAFVNKQSTTHDPSSFLVKNRLPPQDHHTYEEAVKRPIQEPVLSPRGRQLAGLDPY